MSRNRVDIDAETLLGSRGRVKVLGILAESGELNISEVARRAGMNYSSVESHLEKLKALGLAREKRYGKIRIFEASFMELTVKFEREMGVRVDMEPS